MAWKFDIKKLPKPATVDNEGLIVGNLRAGDPQISPHFKAHEFACADCKDYKVAITLLENLELAREKAGIALEVASTTLQSPTNPTGSGYRCKKHNAAVGGVGDSVHTLGKAADVSSSLPVLQLYNLLGSIPAFQNGGMGRYKWGVHVDLGARRRWLG